MPSPFDKYLEPSEIMKKGIQKMLDGGRERMEEMHNNLTKLFAENPGLEEEFNNLDRVNPAGGSFR